MADYNNHVAIESTKINWGYVEVDSGLNIQEVTVTFDEAFTDLATVSVQASFESTTANNLALDYGYLKVPCVVHGLSLTGCKIVAAVGPSQLGNGKINYSAQGE